MNEILQEIYFDEDQNTKKTYVDFRIRSNTLIPQEVSYNLGVKPTKAWAKGERYLSKAFDPQTKKISSIWHLRPWGMWHLDTKNTLPDKKVEKHILYLLSIIEPKKDNLDYYLKRKDEYSISVYIHWEPVDDWGSYEINSNVLWRMSSLCHYIEFMFITTNG